MGYYDEDGDYHSYRTSNQRVGDPQNAEKSREPSSRPWASQAVEGVPSDNVSIPCHHIRLGDFLILQDRPCQVIRISTSSDTGQYHYHGIDLFTKQLYKESSFIANPAPSVVIQSMLGPVFKQYRVLDIQDGQIIAMTETGEVKQGLPVIDQFNFYSRLSNAFESGYGSVRVLVLNDGSRELAVDMKVYPGLRPGKDDIPLHAVARNGEQSMVRDILNEGADVNQLDKFKRTALFGAVENHYDAVVHLLVEADINLNVVDICGQTALDVAASDPKSHSMAYLLLEKGALPTESVSPSILMLLSASAKGDTEKVRHLLDRDISASETSERQNGSDSLTDNLQQVQPNDRDRLGYTALHEAACFGHHQIASMLIEHGADVDAVITLGGETVLHAVIERGRKHRRFLTEGRENSPRLAEGHVQVVEVLLRKGASARRRRQDGRTVQDLVSEELMSPDLTSVEQRILQQILVLLSSPSDGKEATKREAEPQAAGVDNRTMTLCNFFELRLQCHPSRRDPKPCEVLIGNFLYNQTTRDFGPHVVQQLETWAASQSAEDYWRWVHLPVNNKVWVEDIIGPLSGLKGTTLRAYSDAMRKFIDGSYHEVRGPAPHARLRRPLFTPFLGSHGGVFSLVVPFFDTEVLECLSGEGCQDPECNNNFRNKKELGEIYNTPGDNPGNLHVPFTLDQSYYLSLTDSTYRDEDQVVVKYAKRQEKEAGHDCQPKRLLMVNQMWVLKIDAKTVITALPDRRHPGGKTNLFAHISNVMQQDPPLDLNSMILRMIKCAIDFIDAPTNAGLNENLFDIFEQSIAHWAQREATCYKAFHREQETPRDSSHFKSSDEKKRQEDEEDMCDINQEVGYIREIKDIKDELRMIERVLEDQRTVVDQYEAGQRSSPSSEKDTLEGLKQSLFFRISKVQKLSRDASSVEDSLNHLLDIKQKQGNLNVARDTRRLADQAERRALDGEWQTKLLFIFTIVTVIFTPVSFVCTFLAVPTRDFPRYNGDGDVAWRWWQVFVGALVTEVATFMAVGVYWVAQKESNEIAALYQKLRRVGFYQSNLPNRNLPL